MAEFIDLTQIELETNSPLWQIIRLDHELTIQITNNTDEDELHGKVALLPEIRRNYRMLAELKFLGHYLKDPNAGWFGLVMRAQDVDNFELVWFMPNIKHTENVAYIPVAHGIVPWWTEAYATQYKGQVELPEKDWFLVQLDVIGDEFTLYIDNEKIMQKRFTYYLKNGRPGFYIGTATNAAFRLVKLEEFD